MSVIAHFNPQKHGIDSAIALLLATERATGFAISNLVPTNEIHLVDEQSGETEVLQLNPKHPALLMVALQTEALEVRVALGMSRENGERRGWSRIIAELEAPNASLRTLMPKPLPNRIAFVSLILRGLIANALEGIAAYGACQSVHIDNLGHAHLPPNVNRKRGYYLYMRGASVVSYDDGSTEMGVRLSEEVRELGLDGRDFEGLPDDWHREKWAVMYGSSKAPRPYEEAGITGEELQVVVRDSLARFHTQLEEEE